MERQFVERSAEVDLSAEGIVEKSAGNFCLDAQILSLDRYQHLNRGILALWVEVNVIEFRVHVYIINANAEQPDMPLLHSLYFRHNASARL